MTTKEKIEVMQAYVDGKQIQIRAAGNNKRDWEDFNFGEPCWDWYETEYRIKPEEEKPKRMTKRQLAEWLARGFGESKTGFANNICTVYTYPQWHEDEPVKDRTIRPWGSAEWIEPTVDIYERDCKGVK